MRVVRYSGRLEKGLRRINPRGYDLGRLDASESPVVGQFEFPELAGRGMAGLGDGNRGTDIRAAWLRIGSELGRTRWKDCDFVATLTHGGDGILRDKKRE